MDILHPAQGCLIIRQIDHSILPAVQRDPVFLCLLQGRPEDCLKESLSDLARVLLEDRSCQFFQYTGQMCPHHFIDPVSSLRETDRRDMVQYCLHRGPDRRGIQDVISAVRAAIDPGEYQFRFLSCREQPVKRSAYAVRRSCVKTVCLHAFHREIRFFLHLHRFVQSDPVRHGTALLRRSNDRNVSQSFRRIRKHRKIRRPDTVVIRDQHSHNLFTPRDVSPLFRP